MKKDNRNKLKDGVYMNVWIEREQKEFLASTADENGTCMSDEIRMLLEQAMNDKE